MFFLQYSTLSHFCIEYTKHAMHTTAALQRVNFPSNCIPPPPPLLCFQNENVKVRVKYSFVLYTDFAGSPSTLELSPPT